MISQTDTDVRIAISLLYVSNNCTKSQMILVTNVKTIGGLNEKVNLEAIQTEEVEPRR